MVNTGFEVQVISAGGLPGVEHDWALLAEHAIEPNPFYEPWMLLPALSVVEINREVEVALVWYRNPANAKAKPLLVGFFPLTIKRRYKGLPVSAANILTHIYCFSGAPLLHSEHAKPALDAYFRWQKAPASGTRITTFQSLPTDGRFHQLLLDALHSHAHVHFIERRYTRAVYRCPADPAEYIAGHLSSKALKHSRRQQELLSEQGTLEFRQLAPDDDVAPWVSDFLQMEASGWKGSVGTALASLESHALFFRAVAQAAHERHRLKMSGLWLNGRAIAARTVFRAGEGSYLFKIAYDEAYAKYSPGTLLELACIRQEDGNQHGWEDSCTSVNNMVYKRLWRDRRTVEDLAVSPGTFWGDLVLSVLPFLGFAKSRLSRLAAKRHEKATRSQHAE